MVCLLHTGVTRQKAAEIVGVGRGTVQRYVAAYRDGGLDGLRRWDPNQAMAATGTEGPTHKPTFAHPLPHAGDGSGRILTDRLM